MYLTRRQIVKLSSWGLAILWSFSLRIGGDQLILVSANAVTASSGVVSFNKSPRLIDAHTTFSASNVPGAIYYFKLRPLRKP